MPRRSYTPASKPFFPGSILNDGRHQTILIILKHHQGSSHPSNLTGTPAAARSRFNTPMFITPSWNREAARAASAFPSLKTSTKILAGPSSPGRNHRYRNCIRHSPRQYQVIPCQCAVPIHAGKQNLTGPELNPPGGPIPLHQAPWECAPPSITTSQRAGLLPGTYRASMARNHTLCPKAGRTVFQ